MMNALTTKEALCIADVFNGIHLTDETATAARVYNDVVDALVMDSMGEKWDFTPEQLDSFVVHLEVLDDKHAAYMIRCVKAFWESAPHEDIRQSLIEAGLVPPPIRRTP